jgi:hypothetical protein
MAISTAFVYDTIPFMKTVEKVTNPCFQDTEFATVMKGKYVMNAWDKTAGLGESVGEVSGSDKESVNDALNPGSDNGSVNDEVNPTNPIANLLSQQSVTESEGMTYVRLPGGIEGLANLSSERPQSDYTKTRYIDVPEQFEGIPQADGVKVIEGNQNSRHGKRTRKRSPTPVNQDLRRWKTYQNNYSSICTSSLGCAPDNDYTPPVVNSSTSS